MKTNGAPDPVDAAIAASEEKAARTFVFNVNMTGGRAAHLQVPLDLSDSEMVSLLAIIAGPARLQLIAEREKGLVVARGLPSSLRPI